MINNCGYVVHSSQREREKKNSVVVKTRCLGFLRKFKVEFVLTNLKPFGPLSFIIIKNEML